MKTIDQLPMLHGKTVLLRVDLNVPMTHGTIDDTTRITRIIPTIQLLLEKQAKIVILSHFGRPKGTFDVRYSLAPLVDALSHALENTEVKFGVDCIGEAAQKAVDSLLPGEVLLLENLRFYPGEEKNDPEFSQALAKLGDIYVNDTFSCSHRAHASIVGLATLLPAFAGLLLTDELHQLETILSTPTLPMMAIVGGSKISTKLELLDTLLHKVEYLVIGGAMANTFLAAAGSPVGKSLMEPDLIETARNILAQSKKLGCHVIMPVDVVVAKTLAPHVPTRVIFPEEIAEDEMILDLGPVTCQAIIQCLRDKIHTVVWNGPLGAFEFSPFEVGTFTIARIVALLTHQGRIKSIAGGGDSVAALTAVGLQDGFSYLSTAGGAFLEWLEGKNLPGIEALQSFASLEVKDSKRIRL